MPAIPAVTLHPSPDDAVSRVAFDENGDNVLSATWAGSVSIHATTTGALLTEAKKYKSAFLDAGWEGKSQIYGASLDGSVLSASIHDAVVSPWETIGVHSAAVRALVPAVGSNSPLLLTGSWDSTLRAWDTRVSTNKRGAAAAGSSSTTTPGVINVNTQGKVFGAARCGPNCAIAITSQKRVLVLDIRNPSSFLHDRAPPTLAYQLRGISASGDGSQYVVGSTEGRVAVEWLASDKESFSFRCHRVDGLIFPVNCITHNRRYESFATGGADGHVAFWDGEARKRIAQYPRYPTSIASIDFDVESRRLAVAVSYTFEEGEKDHPPDDVHILPVSDAHIAPKHSRGSDADVDDAT